jgi:hypothetical protein
VYVSAVSAYKILKFTHETKWNFKRGDH